MSTFPFPLGTHVRVKRRGDHAWLLGRVVYIPSAAKRDILREDGKTFTYYIHNIRELSSVELEPEEGAKPLAQSYEIPIQGK